MKPDSVTVTKPETPYYAFWVRGFGGSAYQGEGYGNAVDIGSDRTITFDSDYAAKIYGDTCAMRLSSGEWTGQPEIIQNETGVLSAKAGFNDISRLVEGYGKKGAVNLAGLFAEKARRHDYDGNPHIVYIVSEKLFHLKHYETLINDKSLKARVYRGTGRAALLSAAAALHKDYHQEESQNPGFIRQNNRFVIAGLHFRVATHQNSADLPPALTGLDQNLLKSQKTTPVVHLFREIFPVYRR